MQTANPATGSVRALDEQAEPPTCIKSPAAALPEEAPSLPSKLCFGRVAARRYVSGFVFGLTKLGLQFLEPRNETSQVKCIANFPAMRGGALLQTWRKGDV